MTLKGFDSEKMKSAESITSAILFKPFSFVILESSRRPIFEYAIAGEYFFRSETRELLKLSLIAQSTQTQLSK